MVGRSHQLRSSPTRPRRTYRCTSQLHGSATRSSRPSCQNRTSPSTRPTAPCRPVTLPSTSPSRCTAPMRSRRCGRRCASSTRPSRPSRSRATTSSSRRIGTMGGITVCSCTCLWHWRSGSGRQAGRHGSPRAGSSAAEWPSTSRRRGMGREDTDMAVDMEPAEGCRRREGSARRE